MAPYPSPSHQRDDRAFSVTPKANAVEAFQMEEGVGRDFTFAIIRYSAHHIQLLCVGLWKGSQGPPDVRKEIWSQTTNTTVGHQLVLLLTYNLEWMTEAT